MTAPHLPNRIRVLRRLRPSQPYVGFLVVFLIIWLLYPSANHWANSVLLAGNGNQIKLPTFSFLAMFASVAIAGISSHRSTTYWARPLTLALAVLSVAMVTIERGCDVDHVLIYGWCVVALGKLLENKDIERAGWLLMVIAIPMEFMPSRIPGIPNFPLFSKHS